MAVAPKSGGTITALGVSREARDNDDLERLVLQGVKKLVRKWMEKRTLRGPLSRSCLDSALLARREYCPQMIAEGDTNADHALLRSACLCLHDLSLAVRRQDGFLPVAGDAAWRRRWRSRRGSGRSPRIESWRRRPVLRHEMPVELHEGERGVHRRQVSISRP
jgi:hypothetical protein